MAAQAKVAELAVQVTEHERRIGCLDKDLKGVDGKLDEISKLLTKQSVYLSIGVWVFSGVGILVIGLIWAVLTHSVELVRP